MLVDPLGKPVPFGQLAGKALATGDAANAQDYVFGWKVKGTYKGQALAGSGKVGGMLALQDASKPFRYRPRSVPAAPVPRWSAP